MKCQVSIFISLIYAAWIRCVILLLFVFSGFDPFVTSREKRFCIVEMAFRTKEMAFRIKSSFIRVNVEAASFDFPFANFRRLGTLRNLFLICLPWFWPFCHIAKIRYCILKRAFETKLSKLGWHVYLPASVFILLNSNAWRRFFICDVF